MKGHDLGVDGGFGHGQRRQQPGERGPRRTRGRCLAVPGAVPGGSRGRGASRNGNHLGEADSSSSLSTGHPAGRACYTVRRTRIATACRVATTRDE